jgi:integrase
MRQQTGCIYIKGDSWALRWRETVRTPEGKQARKMRFKILGDVTAEHRRNKDRSTGKLRIPDEIQSAADEITEAANRNPLTSVMLTIDEFVTEYLKDKKREIRQGTHDGYTQLWNKYLLPRIGETVLRKFSRHDAFLLWQQIAKDYPSLSRQTMSHIRFLLGGIFNSALNCGLYKGENPALADLPFGLRGRKQSEVYTADEVIKMLALFVGQLKVQAVIALAWASALRMGELSAVSWDCYDRTDDGAVIHVKQANWRGLISAPKTDSSVDDVYISNDICSYIDAFRKSMGNPAEGFCFGHVPEKPLNMDNLVRRVIRPVLETARLKWKGWHAFRRGNATYLAKQSTGDGMSDAARMLRHSDEGVTAEHYVKVSRQQKRVLAARKVVAVAEQRQSQRHGLAKV